jgi:hypothetical protein
MIEKPVDLTTDILIAIREDIAEFRAETVTRLDRLESTIAKVRRDQAGMLVMTRGAVGEFDKRMIAVETRLVELESARS